MGALGYTSSFSDACIFGSWGQVRKYVFIEGFWKYRLDEKVRIRICEYRFVGNLVHDMIIDVYMHILYYNSLERLVELLNEFIRHEGETIAL